jgi:hypothetical protein
MGKKKNLANLISLAALGAAAGLTLAACNKSPNDPSEDEVKAAIAAFSAECEASGKVVGTSASCHGTNECAGVDGVTGKTHDCKTHASCGGSVWCEEPAG